MTQRNLLSTVYANGADLLKQVKALIASGADPSAVTKYGESPLRVASNNARLDVVKLLLDAGAQAAQLQWSPSFYAVAFGSLNDLRNSLAEHDDLEARDFWHRTPWLLAIQSGRIDKTALLLELGADPTAVGRCGKTPMAYAVQHDRADMLQWLIDQGLDIEATDDFSDTALISAAEHGAQACLRRLIDAGADIFRTNDIPQRAIEIASTLPIVHMLVEAGEDINDINEETHALLLGVKTDASPLVTTDEYLSGRHRRFGAANPEKVQIPFWLEMIRAGASAWRARDSFKQSDAEGDAPVWSYKRFGRSTSILEDGRIIEIAGEHEDYYDPDFCIYNDVTVFHKDGDIDIYAYPEAVFPPTDFHTATPLEDFIYIIGNLGYMSARRPGHTPVYRLNTASFKIEEIETTGDNPGWISRHKTHRTAARTLRLEGGEILAPSGKLETNTNVYELNLDQLTWTCLAPDLTQSEKP